MTAVCADDRLRLFESCIALAWQGAHQHKAYAAQFGLTLEDLAQEACLGVWQATRTFRPELGHKFTTYAALSVWQRIRRAITVAKRYAPDRPSVPEPRESSPDDREEAEVLIGRGLAKLTPRQREAVRLKHGLGGGKPLPTAAVGRRLGLPSNRAAQLLDGAMADLGVAVLRGRAVV